MCGAGVHPDLSVRLGLADGPFEPGVHPGGHGFHDGGDGRLRKAVRELGQNHPSMNSAIVEYIGGIEVIKAFNQGKQSYARFSDSVKANASYFYHWMKSCQMPVSLARAISPTTMITILPVGWLLYTGGSLPIETFITTIVLPLGIAGPLLAAMDFVDSLAKVGTIVGSVDAI